jgi:translation elongation factor EF-Tu-like GTPase
MNTDESGEDFVLAIVDVLSVTGRGTAVIGSIESGVLRTGETVEDWDDDQLVATV